MSFGTKATILSALRKAYDPAEARDAGGRVIEAIFGLEVPTVDELRILEAAFGAIRDEFSRRVAGEEARAAVEEVEALRQGREVLGGR